MTGDETSRTPRFRIVLEISFDDVDPWDPSGYPDLLARWAEFLGKNEAFPSRDVKLREILTIGAVDDYDDWRNNRGPYDVSSWPTEGTGYVRGRDDGTDS